jgi:hypothetical protein
MSDPRPYADTDIPPDQDSTAGIPRWVKASGIVVLVLAVLFVILQLTGAGPGDHNPGDRGNHGLGDEPAVQPAWS